MSRDLGLECHSWSDAVDLEGLSTVECAEQ